MLGFVCALEFGAVMCVVAWRVGTRLVRVAVAVLMLILLISFIITICKLQQHNNSQKYLELIIWASWELSWQSSILKSLSTQSTKR